MAPLISDPGVGNSVTSLSVGGNDIFIKLNAMVALSGQRTWGAVVPTASITVDIVAMFTPQVLSMAIVDFAWRWHQ